MHRRHHLHWAPCGLQPNGYGIIILAVFLRNSPKQGPDNFSSFAWQDRTGRHCFAASLAYQPLVPYPRLHSSGQATPNQNQFVMRVFGSQGKTLQSNAQTKHRLRVSLPQKVA